MAVRNFAFVTWKDAMKVDVQTEKTESTNFPKSGSHLKTVGARRVTAASYIVTAHKYWVPLYKI
jgi:hypothetical protein